MLGLSICLTFVKCVGSFTALFWIANISRKILFVGGSLIMAHCWICFSVIRLNLNEDSDNSCGIMIFLTCIFIVANQWSYGSLSWVITFELHGSKANIFIIASGFFFYSVLDLVDSYIPKDKWIVRHRDIYLLFIYSAFSFLVSAL